MKRVETQPVETTVYSLSGAAPGPIADSDRREGDRLTTLYRVGSILIEQKRELCLIKNISAGGMMLRLYCSVAESTPVTIELKSGQPISGRISWTRDHHAGVSFDQPIDVIDILSATMDGPRPRMPRVEIECFATLREGANTIRVKVCNVSQGGAKIACETLLPHGADVIITLPGLPPQPGVACWTDGGFTGITFNRLLPLSELVAWLQERRNTHHSAS
ncbi:PilZ domain-containing protein [Sphingomonas sp. G124]|uniref:PilZ domain-containing protein n=1 Tax=Sphingomonas cremea TaxID=2904799 RepID=A0A9X1QJH2_9SPHN|nr:PilZ domain-containing protein [Sphingomonas cremea]MCF2513861.1 PilZ domain-containing protein [Sphingomonas cremea]